MQIEQQHACSSMKTVPAESENTVGSWRIVKELGIGSTARVYLVTDPSTKKLAAMKVFTLIPPIASKLLKMEEDNMKHLSHPNIISYLESYDSVEVNNQTVSALVTEYAPNEALFELLERKGVLSEHEARKYFEQLIDALQHMHQKHIAHRDIKLENILLDERNNLKLADFGFSQKFDSDQQFTRPAGTDMYFSPEIHSGLPYSGESADIFAAGIILFVMAVGHMPFSRATLKDQVYSLLVGGDPENFWQFHEKISAMHKKKFAISKEAKMLIASMLEYRPSRRATINDILNSTWMQSKPSEDQKGSDI